MKTKQVAAQLYTVREHLKTPQDIAASLKKVRAAGYEAVQISGMGPIPEEELVAILRGEGLTCCATHEPADKILTDPQAVVARLKKLGCAFTAYPYPGGITFNSEADVKAFAARLNAAGKVMSEAGITLTYHNHHIEFRRVGRRTILESIYKLTDSRYLQGEIDTYWVQYGGGDPVQWCKRLKGRLPLLHMKDLGIDAENKVVFTEIGSGNLNWKKIVAAAEKSGCQWFIVEQDTCKRDAFESLKISFDFIKKRLCKE